MIAHSPRNTEPGASAEKTDIDVAATPARALRTTSSALSQDIPVTQIRPSPTNPRQDFDDESMAALTASVAEHGVLEPVIVLRRPDGTSTYELIAGHRRWLAAGRAGLDRIPARILLGVDGLAALQLQALENLQRADLNPIEEARQFKLLADAGMKQAAIAQTVGKSQPFVANRLRILDLPDDVQALVRAGKLSAAHGVSLARFSAFPAIASKIAELAAKKSSTVKEIDSRKLPFSWELSQHKLVVGIYTTQNGFDATICKDCPFGAYRVDGSGWCLNPPHAEELRQLAHAERKRAAEAETARIKAEHPDLGNAIAWAPATQLQRWSPPTGCTDDCPCAAVVIQKDHDGNLSQMSVCTDRPRYEELQRLDRAREETANRQQEAEHLARALDALTEAHAAAILAYLALERLTRDTIDQAIEALALPYTHEHKDHAKYEPPAEHDARRARNLTALAALSPEQAIALAAQATLRYEIHQRYAVGYQPPSPLTDWLLGETQTTTPANTPRPHAGPIRAVDFAALPEAEQRRILDAATPGLTRTSTPLDDPADDDEYPRESDLTCERCGEPVVIRSRDEDKALAHDLANGGPIDPLCDSCAGADWDDVTADQHAQLHALPVGGCDACDQRATAIGYAAMGIER